MLTTEFTRGGDSQRLLTRQNHATRETSRLRAVSRTASFRSTESFWIASIRGRSGLFNPRPRSSKNRQEIRPFSCQIGQRRADAAQP